MTRVNDDGPRAKERAENVAVLCDPRSTTSDMTAAVAALSEDYSLAELLRMRMEANR